MKEIKLLSLDMDGTTYFKMGSVVPANVKPIQKAIAQGIEVVFVTGRPPLAGPNQLQENGFATKNTLLIAHNGGVIYDFKNQKVIKSNPINPEMARKAFSLLNQPEYQDSILWGYVDDLKTMITNAENPGSKDNKPLEYSLEMNFFDGQYLKMTSEKLANLTNSFSKMLAFNAKPEFLKALEKIGFEIASSNGIDAEVTAPKVNKKSALEWLTKQLSIQPENIMAIGDGANDLSMIEYAGVGVALKNSIPAVKEVANLYIDLTNEEGAVGFVIENYVLKGEIKDEG